VAERPEYNEDFMDLLSALQGAEVEYVIMGAHALAAHGVVRASGDLDVFVRPSETNAGRVILALQAFGAPLQAHGVSETDFSREGTVYQLGLPPRRIDMLTAVSGLTFDQACDGGMTLRIGDVEFRVPSRENLLLNKRASGRPKDLEDARRLQELVDSEATNGGGAQEKP
jgi:hypothetical protein